MSLFLSDKELNFFNNLNEELINQILGQNIILFKVYSETTDANIYGESSMKTFKSGINFYALIEYNEPEITNSATGLSQDRRIILYIQRKTLSDLNVIVNEGDFLYWDNQYFEITKVTEPQLIEGLPTNKFNIKVEATSADIGQLNIIERIE